MSEILGVSAVVILAGLLIASWLTDSKLLKLATLGFFFLYPVMIHQVQFPRNSNEILGFVGNVLKYWFVQVWGQVWNFIQRKI